MDIDDPRLDYELIVRQQPKAARMCGLADRRPIDPPPIIQLRVLEYPHPSSSRATPVVSNDFLQNPYYFMFASLASPDSDDELHVLKDGKTRCTTGSIVSSLYHLKDAENNNEDAGFFVFPDLSVRTEGSYRLKLSLFEVKGAKVHHCKSIFSNPFYVYTAKKFPGMEESTPLSCSLADQGIKIRIRKEIRQRKKTSGVNPIGPDDGGSTSAAAGADQSSSASLSPTISSSSTKRIRHVSESGKGKGKAITRVVKRPKLVDSSPTLEPIDDALNGDASSSLANQPSAAPLSGHVAEQPWSTSESLSSGASSSNNTAPWTTPLMSSPSQPISPSALTEKDFSSALQPQASSAATSQQQQQLSSSTSSYAPSPSPHNHPPPQHSPSWAHHPAPPPRMPSSASILPQTQSYAPSPSLSYSTTGPQSASTSTATPSPSMPPQQHHNHHPPGTISSPRVSLHLPSTSAPDSSVAIAPAPAAGPGAGSLTIAAPMPRHSRQLSQQSLYDAIPSMPPPPSQSQSTQPSSQPLDTTPGMYRNPHPHEMHAPPQQQQPHPPPPGSMPYAPSYATPRYYSPHPQPSSMYSYDAPPPPPPEFMPSTGTTIHIDREGRERHHGGEALPLDGPPPPSQASSSSSTQQYYSYDQNGHAIPHHPHPQHHQHQQPHYAPSVPPHPHAQQASTSTAPGSYSGYLPPGSMGPHSSSSSSMNGRGDQTHMSYGGIVAPYHTTQPHPSHRPQQQQHAPPPPTQHHQHHHSGSYPGGGGVMSYPSGPGQAASSSASSTTSATPSSMESQSQAGPSYAPFSRRLSSSGLAYGDSYSSNGPGMSAGGGAMGGGGERLARVESPFSSSGAEDHHHSHRGGGGYDAGVQQNLTLPPLRGGLPVQYGSSQHHHLSPPLQQQQQQQSSSPAMHPSQSAMPPMAHQSGSGGGPYYPSPSSHLPTHAAQSMHRTMSMSSSTGPEYGYPPPGPVDPSLTAPPSSYPQHHHPIHPEMYGGGGSRGMPPQQQQQQGWKTQQLGPQPSQHPGGVPALMMMNNNNSNDRSPSIAHLGMGGGGEGAVHLMRSHSSASMVSAGGGSVMGDRISFAALASEEDEDRKRPLSIGNIVSNPPN